MSIVISIDIGTSKICAAAYCTQRMALLGCKSVENSSFVEGQPAGNYEQSASLIVEYAMATAKSLLESDAVAACDVDGIAVTGQMHGVLLVDGKCKPVTNLITWRDQRTCALAVSIGEKYATANGCGLRTGYGGASLGFLAHNKEFGRDYKALSISDYLCAVLSGKISSEPTHAASWGIYDITSQQWNWKMVSELSIPVHILPEIKPASRALGNILPGVAAELGLSDKVLIYSPIGDNQAAVIGARGQTSDAAVLNLGTGGQISIPQNDGQYIGGFETRPMPDGTFILVGASICGGWTYAYLKDFFKSVVSEMAGIQLDDQQVYARMNSFLDINSDILPIEVDPRFCGTRTDPSIRGLIKSIDAHNLTPKQLTKGFAKAMVQELFDMIPANCFGNFSTVTACGNAIRKNPAILKIAAECFGKPVYPAQTNEEASVGAALAAIDMAGK